MLQPSCRTTGAPSYYNYKGNRKTWEQHRKEDLPHITYCGKIAVAPDDARRWFMREHPTGTW
eukprot:3282115-Pyramimonas_sp.AAC.1